MSETTNTSGMPESRRFRFSIGTLLLWIAIFALTANTMVMSRQISQMQQERSTQPPLPPKEVARQFEKSTTLGPITSSVRDVRYSEDADAYRVEFSWADSDTGKTWYSDVRLKNDGFGVYYGQIRNGPFVQPLGSTSHAVVVKSPTTFSE